MEKVMGNMLKAFERSEEGLKKMAVSCTPTNILFVVESDDGPVSGADIAFVPLLHLSPLVSKLYANIGMIGNNETVLQESSEIVSNFTASYKIDEVDEVTQKCKLVPQEIGQKRFKYGVANATGDVDGPKNWFGHVSSQYKPVENKTHHPINMKGLLSVVPFVQGALNDEMNNVNKDGCHDRSLLRDMQHYKKEKMENKEPTIRSKSTEDEESTPVIDPSLISVEYTCTDQLEGELSFKNKEFFRTYDLVICFGEHSSNVVRKVFKGLGLNIPILPKIPSVVHADEFLYAKDQIDRIRNKVEHPLDRWTEAWGMTFPSKMLDFHFTTDTFCSHFRSGTLSEDQLRSKLNQNDPQDLDGLIFYSNEMVRKPNLEEYKLIEDKVLDERIEDKLLDSTVTLVEGEDLIKPFKRRKIMRNNIKPFERRKIMRNNIMANRLATGSQKPFIPKNKDKERIVVGMLSSRRSNRSPTLFEEYLVMERTVPSDDWVVVPKEGNTDTHRVVNKAMKNFYAAMLSHSDSDEYLDVYMVFSFTKLVPVSENENILSKKKPKKMSERYFTEEAQKWLHKSVNIWPRCDLGWYKCLLKENSNLFVEWTHRLTAVNLFHAIPPLMKHIKPSPEHSLDPAKYDEKFKALYQSQNVRIKPSKRHDKHSRCTW